jgi:hypothetical protein
MFSCCRYLLKLQLGVKSKNRWGEEGRPVIQETATERSKEELAGFSRGIRYRRIKPAMDDKFPRFRKQARKETIQVKVFN